jgi:uncharacterized MAPEG superfamily protein
VTIEIRLLLWAVLFGLVQSVATGVAVMRQRGVTFTAGARDDQRPITGWEGRVVRAFANFMETFPFFAVVVLAGAFLQRHGTQTVIGSYLYFWGRIVYWPLYVGGVPYARSLCYTVATLGIVMVFAGITG